MENDKNLSIQVLLEEYRTVSQDIQIYIKEMIKCFPYGAILIALYLGWGLVNQNQGSEFTNKINEVIPYGFVILSIYFLSLSYIKVGLMNYRADLEKKINNILGKQLMSFDSIYIPMVQSRGFLRLGYRWYARLPTPMFFLGILIIISSMIVFTYEKVTNHKLIVLILLLICGLLTLYVFFIYPKLIIRAQNNINTTNSSGIRKELKEVLIFIALIIIYIFIKSYIAGRAYFIIPAIFLCAIYFVYLIKTDKNFIKEGGIRFDNIFSSIKLTSYFFIPIIFILLIISYKLGKLYFSSSIIYLIILYPIWGLSQQFMFQSFFHTRLIRLNTAPWSILIVALFYSLVHLPDIKLTFMTFIGGIIFSHIFLKHPNIIPLGLAQGITAVVVYYTILGKNVLKTFIDSI